MRNIKVPEGYADQLLPELFMTVEGEGDDAYRSTYDTKEEAVDNNSHTGTLVATYKLVKVERLALRRTTAIVPVEEGNL